MGTENPEPTRFDECEVSRLPLSNILTFKHKIKVYVSSKIFSHTLNHTYKSQLKPKTLFLLFGFLSTSFSKLFNYCVKNRTGGGYS